MTIARRCESCGACDTLGNPIESALFFPDKVRKMFCHECIASFGVVCLGCGLTWLEKGARSALLKCPLCSEEGYCSINPYVDTFGIEIETESRTASQLEEDELDPDVDYDEDADQDHNYDTRNQSLESLLKDHPELTGIIMDSHQDGSLIEGIEFSLNPLTIHELKSMLPVMLRFLKGHGLSAKSPRCGMHIHFPCYASNGMLVDYGSMIDAYRVFPNQIHAICERGIGEQGRNSTYYKTPSFSGSSIYFNRQVYMTTKQISEEKPSQIQKYLCLSKRWMYRTYEFRQPAGTMSFKGIMARLRLAAFLKALGTPSIKTGQASDLNDPMQRRIWTHRLYKTPYIGDFIKGIPAAV